MLIPTPFETVENKCRRPRFRTSTAIPSWSSSNSTQSFEKLFIQCLVRAGQCSRHADERRTVTVSHRPNRIPTWRSSSNCPALKKPKTREFSTWTDVKSRADGTAVELSKEEVKGLVDYYNPMSDETSHIPSMDTYADEPDQPIPPDPPPEDEQIVIERIILDLQEHIQHEDSSHDLIWDAYQRLPHPRASHIPDYLLGELLHHLSVVPYKTEPSMLRYLSLIDDAQAINAPIKASHWTSAIAFAGRCLRRISSAEVESALHLWRRMEHDAGVKGTNITFNTLFDIATKAGKFVLAEMIMKEMETRNLKFNRHFRTGLIYHYGLRADGNGVRKAYRDLVDAGEIVDSAVITCVVQSLLKCGEAVAAEQVFERAKRLHWQKRDEYEAKVAANAARSTGVNATMEQLVPPPMPPTDWRSSRQLGINLDHAAGTLRQTLDTKTRERIQNSVPLAPSIRTYRALIYYHAVTAGDIDRATELLNEMQDYDIKVDGICYLHMFKGFSMHGGVAYTAWTRRRLEHLWKEFSSLVEHDGLGWRRRNIQTPSASWAPLMQIYINTASAEFVLRAFARVVGYQRAWEIWEDVKGKWESNMDDSDLEYMDQVLDRLHPEWRSSGIGDEEDRELHADDWEEEVQELEDEKEDDSLS